jgi:hypothetical protein
MSNVVEFPGAEDKFSKREVNDRHAEAFRDLEGQIADCEMMAHVALQMAEPFLGDGEAEEAMFAVRHVCEMLEKLKADYYTAWQNERAIEP